MEGKRQGKQVVILFPRAQIDNICLQCWPGNQTSKCYLRTSSPLFSLCEASEEIAALREEQATFRVHVFDCGLQHIAAVSVRQFSKHFDTFTQLSYGYVYFAKT